MIAGVPWWLAAAGLASIAVHGWLLTPYPDRLLHRIRGRLTQISSGPAGATALSPPGNAVRGEAAGPEDPTLTEPELVLLNRVRAIVNGHHLCPVITENGKQLADAYRKAMPTATDRDLAKLMLAQVAITHRTIRESATPADGLLVCSDAMLGAVIDLTRLDEEVTTR